MQKIPTLFDRHRRGPKRGRVYNHANVDLSEYDYVMATAKFDGVCVMWDGERWWRRREVKPGKPIPPNVTIVDVDETTGKSFGWIPLFTDSENKWLWQSINDYSDAREGIVNPGSYECIGPHHQGNPHDFEYDTLERHGGTVLAKVPVEFEALGEWLVNQTWLEGVVWWQVERTDEGWKFVKPVAKIKRKDYGLPWPPKKDEDR